MFNFADKDKDGKISYTEFRAMICPPESSERPLETKTSVKKVTIKTEED